MSVKRAFDVVAAVGGLIVLSPIFAVVALLIRLDDGGPVFFRQERIGLHGKVFRIHKFRSMRVESTGSLVTHADDQRITPIGRVLRRTKLDELPQLIDVLQGTMSIVGPRPEVARYVELWDAQARTEILSVRPGISDPASIAYRDEEVELATVEDPERYYREVILPRKVEMYRAYVREQTFAGDLRLIVDTLRAIVRRSDVAP